VHEVAAAILGILPDARVHRDEIAFLQRVIWRHCEKTDCGGETSD
jgi:hypothetical protein